MQTRQTQFEVFVRRHKQNATFGGNGVMRSRRAEPRVKFDRRLVPDRAIGELHLFDLEKVGCRGVDTAGIHKVRLHPEFVPTGIDATRRGRLLMVVSEASFFPAFCRNMKKIGISAALLERITAVDDQNFKRLRSALASVQAVYISPICDPRVRKFIPAGVQEVQMKSSLSDESLETLEAVMLFHNQKS